jgi:hypothetical protein
MSQIIIFDHFFQGNPIVHLNSTLDGERQYFFLNQFVQNSLSLSLFFLNFLVVQSKFQKFIISFVCKLIKFMSLAKMPKHLTNTATIIKVSSSLKKVIPTLVPEETILQHT